MFVCFSFLDYSFYFMKVGNLREGEALIVAKAVSPSRALPLLATPLFGVVPICWVVDGKAARLWVCSLGIGSVKNM